MAKKSTPRPVQNVTPGADPYQRGSRSGKNLGVMIGAVCLLVFIIFEDLWIGTLACALAFTVLFVMQVFLEKSKTFFTSLYLYAAVGTAVLAYAEYKFAILTDLLTIG